MSAERDLDEPGPELDFEHVGTFRVDERLVVCDVEYADPRFAGMRRGSVGLDFECEVEPGIWQALVARAQVSDSEADEPGEIQMVLLIHDRELEIDVPLDHAEAIGMLRIDSGRITALAPDLRADTDIRTALIEAPREQVPCMLRELGADPDDDPRGALFDVDTSGVFAIYAPPGRPRTALFVALG